MTTVIILNTVGLVILFAISTVFFFMLMKAYDQIRKLKGQKADAEQRANYHKDQLKIRAGYNNEKGHDLGDKGERQ